MLHPSYTELMEKINKEGEQGEQERLLQVMNL